ncbi:hypothetical protein B5L94_17045 [Klebsiella pneumoniae]|uniref:hypothetical protein n=1 Tax=Klebsiella pneumoniae TaxID=573 RepID=UPI000B4019FA|nr:hypothetical protein [Klebsiella pneumoniae]OVG30772.1 hypothetical protein B5L94_17045 [Klebsiella pneumoniae]
MTDITELAQREKFEAWWEREYKHLEASKYTDAVPHIKYGFWMAYQAGGAELVEALEKAQTERDEFRSRLKLERSILEDADKRIAELESHKAALLKFIRDSCYVFDGADEDISDAYVDAITSGLMPKLEAGSMLLPPLFWVRVKSDGGYEGPIHDSKLEDVRKKSGEWLPLTLAGGIPELESRTVTAAAAAVLAERKRQVAAEGWTPGHDDEYEHGELADAAGCYALSSELFDCAGEPPRPWPWPDEWWKPTNRRRDLVKAGALILAEIERLDRAAGIKVEAE